jgi:hypothetical protein
MIRRLLPAAIGLGAALALAGCGQATEAVDDPATPSPSESSSSATTSTDTSTGTATQAVAPTWPETGCASHSMLSIDYAREPQGYATPEEAALDWAQGEVAGVIPVLVPAQDHSPAGVALVDPTTNEIQAQVTVIKGSTGWWVDGVETCN